MVLKRLLRLVHVVAISIQSKNGLEAISLGETMNNRTMEMTELAGVKRQQLLGLLTEIMLVTQDNLSGLEQIISVNQLLGTTKTALL